MLTIFHQPTEDFQTTTTSTDLKNTGVEGLSIFGNKPNAIVHPLKHDEPDNGLLKDLESQIIASEENEKTDIFNKPLLDNSLRLLNTWSKDSSRNVC